MIGNDLVDLQAAARESSWKRKGYLQKLYTAEEQAALHASENPDAYIWIMWSMKESAYKIHSAKTGERKFAPASLRISSVDLQGNEATGMIECEGHRYFTKTLLRTSYIYTVAAEDSELLSRIYSQVYFRAGDFDYKRYKPACVSHHGDYLALAYC